MFDGFPADMVDPLRSAPFRHHQSRSGQNGEVGRGAILQNVQFFGERIHGARTTVEKLAHDAEAGFLTQGRQQLAKPSAWGNAHSRHRAVSEDLAQMLGVGLVTGSQIPTKRYIMKSRYND